MTASVRIAVLDPLPVFRRGLITILGDAAYETQSPEELLAWIHEEQRPCVLVTLLSTDDWILLDRLREARADMVVIAILADTSIRNHVQAILGGAVAAVARDALPETLRKVLEAAVAGNSLLPVEVVRALTRPQPLHETEEHIPSPQEIGWLRDLAVGTTVARLADRAGYSERAMFRLLRELYQRIGARNRTEALMRAHERGWL
jgi:DNA-binding NarL/FixJ family response regulator